MLLIYILFHNFHDNVCISITMFLDCDLNYGFPFFPQFLLPMTLLRYLEVRAGAGTGARAGAGTGTGTGTGVGE